MIGSADLVKPPQMVVEGHLPAVFGVTPNAPAFLAKGQRAILERGNAPEFVDNDFGGYYDRRGVLKTREKNTPTFRGRFLATDLDVLKWASVLPDAAGTPQESRTWLYSYKRADGTEVWCVWKACKPTGATLTINFDAPMMLEIQMMANKYVETPNPGPDAPIPAGVVYAVAQPGGLPLRFKDLGKFQYGSTELAFKALTLSTSFAMRIQSSNGSETDVYYEPANRRISGTIDVFKQNEDLNEDARRGRNRFAYFVLQNIPGQNDVSATARYPPAGANYITATARIPGEWGNQLKLQIKQGDGAATTATASHTTIIVTLKNGGDTLTNIKAAIDANDDANDHIVTTEITGDAATNTNAAMVATALAGGIDRDTKIVFERFRFQPSNENPQEDTDATIETKSWDADVLGVYSA